MKNLLNHPISTALQAMMAFALVLTSLSVDARPKVEKKLKVACVGNSITYGTGIKDRENDAYPSQLQRMLGDAYEVGNFGRPSATLLAHGHMPYFQQAEWNAAKAFTADIAVVHLGINDTDPRNWPNYRDEFVTDYLHLIDTLRQVNPQVRSLIARLTPTIASHRAPNCGTTRYKRPLKRWLAWQEWNLSISMRRSIIIPTIAWRESIPTPPERVCWP